MSQYSDFFGVASAGGSALPINSYHAFMVTTTDNPTGYNSTTGLYTHPDGTYWVESGNRIADTTGIYPNATGQVGGTTGAPSPQNFPSSPNTINSMSGGEGTTDIVLTEGNTIRKYPNGGGNQITAIGNPANSDSRVSYNSINNTFIVTTQGVSLNFVMYEYNFSTMTSTGFTFSYSTLNTSGPGMTHDPINDRYLIADQTNIYEYSTNGTQTGTFMSNYKSVLGVTTDIGDAAYNTIFNKFFFYTEYFGKKGFEVDQTGTYTGYTVGVGPYASGLSITSDESYLLFGGFNGSPSPRATATFYDLARLVGDPTARTDTSSTKALFVRIG